MNSVILNFFYLILLKAVQSQETYRAGVVEFGVSFQSDIETYFASNTDRYIRLINEAAQQRLDIVVFPESTLNYAFTANRTAIILHHAVEIADPKDAISPCDSDELPAMLKAISCAARDGHVYVVINVSEKLPCDEDTQSDTGDERDCHSDGYYLFNTNVVFNRYGVIVSRYRKTHLFGELAFNTTAKPEVSTFTTDFGVKFGHLICFDLQYYTPSQLLLQRGVDNFVLPLMWYSELPFLTAVQYESAWAYSHNVNLLAAGASSPLSGSGGSGLFAGRQGDRVALMSGETTTRLLVSELFKSPSQGIFNDTPQMISENPRRMNLLRDHLHLYSISFLKPEMFISEAAERICYLDFCCTFNITMSFFGNSSQPPDTPYYHYALAAFRGVRTYSGVASGGVENCGLVACTSLDEDSCGLRFSASTAYSPYIVIEKVTLTGEFTSRDAAHYPVTLTGSMLPLTTDKFSFENSTIDNKLQLTVNLTESQTDLLTFGIFGRVYSMDCDPVTEIRKQKYFKVLGLHASEDCLYMTSSGYYLDYLWSKLGIPLFLLAIYFLEMM